MKATIITDASFCPKTKAAGWAVWISSDSMKGVKQSGQFKVPPNTNTQAELWAAYNGMVLAYRLGARRLLIQSDCTTVGAALRRPNGKHGFADIASLMPGASFEYRHVKGHTKLSAARYYVNRWCDENARLHMKQARKAHGPKPK